MLKKFFAFCCVFVLLCSKIHADGADSSSVVNKSGKVSAFKIGVVTAGTVGFGVVTYDYFNKVWWKPTKVKRFILRDDWNDLLRADKFGHFYFSYLLSDVYKNLFIWTGINSKTSSLLAAGISIIYEVGVVELTDGFTTRWGFSPTDAIVDVLGASFPVFQEFFPELKILTFKWSYTPSGYTWIDYFRFNKLRDMLYKKQFHTDYEGMTFWISVDFQELLPEKVEAFIPDFINIALGYSVKKINYAGAGYSEVFIALDINLLRVNTGFRLLDGIIHTLNYIHLPAPTLQVKPVVKFHYLYF